MKPKAQWTTCKNIVCIRLDNMGDVLMSAPAINALKKSFQCKITLLTSSAAAAIVNCVEGIDDVIIFDAPWVNIHETVTSEVLTPLIELLKQKQFDGAIVFSTFSQNPMPAIMIAYLAQIPLRLAYCRENPYQLLTHWIPEKEPYAYVKHQVRRDLDLVKKIGAVATEEHIRVCLPDNTNDVRQKLSDLGVDVVKPWLVVHPGVSERKREFPIEQWKDLVTELSSLFEYQIIITGTQREQAQAEVIAKGQKNVFNTTGMLAIPEFMRVIKMASLLISVNTSAIHIASAVGTRVVVLYAMTNPQHIPWKVPAKVLLFDVPEDLQSKNEVLRYVRFKYFPGQSAALTTTEILQAAQDLLINPNANILPENMDFKKQAIPA